MYLYGYTCRQIAETLTKSKRRTKKSNVTWSASVILSILQNERHCGDILARKTYTPNYLDHKSKKNRRDRNQYRRENHHEAIVSKDDFIAVQRLIQNARYGYKGLLPKLQVIPAGILHGYVIVHPKWSGFRADDYRLASLSIGKPPAQHSAKSSDSQSGSCDLQGYEMIREQFFDTRSRITLTFSPKQIRFSADCVRKFQTHYIELLVHPDKQMFALHPAQKTMYQRTLWNGVIPLENRVLFSFRKHKRCPLIRSETGIPKQKAFPTIRNRSMSQMNWRLKKQLKVCFFPCVRRFVMTNRTSTYVPTFTFHNYKVYVNASCIKSLPDFDYVQIMVSPTEKKLTLHPCSEYEKKRPAMALCHSQKKSPENSVQNFFCQGNGAYELESGQPL